MLIWRLIKKIDFWLLAAALILVVLGLTVLLGMSALGSSRLITSQLVFALVGLAGFIGAIYFDYRGLNQSAGLIYLIGLFLLGLVFWVGSQAFGARRWIDLGLFQFQPSELAKLVVVIVLAKELSAQTKPSLIGLARVSLLAGLPIILILLQPDLGSASVIAIGALGMLGLKRLPYQWWLAILALVILVSPLAWGSLRPYQKDRLSSFLNPYSDPLGQNYNSHQAEIAIGSGGFLGRGLGQGTQSRLRFLPVAHTDFIFAALSEAIGFVGSSVLILVYIVIVFRLIKAAQSASDEFGRLLVGGWTIVFVYQSFIHIGINLGRLPITGVPLPFMSAGGTQLVVSFLALGLVESVVARNRELS